MQILHLAFLLIGAYFSVLVLTAYAKTGQFLQQASKKLHDVKVKPHVVDLNAKTETRKKRAVSWLKTKLEEFE